MKKGVLNKFAKFIEKKLCWGLFLITLQARGPAILAKRGCSAVVFL